MKNRPDWLKKRDKRKTQRAHDKFARRIRSCKHLEKPNARMNRSLFFFFILLCAYCCKALNRNQTAVTTFGVYFFLSSFARYFLSCIFNRSGCSALCLQHANGLSLTLYYRWYYHQKRLRRQHFALFLKSLTQLAHIYYEFDIWVFRDDSIHKIYHLYYSISFIFGLIQ